mmetsp:Transcript_18285/g.25765  ORF Transcript_18285/g.25765 Transcript_18285/m.25765 type:complete len:348 (+) Transcript_18285:26-1069(+)
MMLTMKLFYLSLLLAPTHAFHNPTPRNVNHVGVYQTKVSRPSLLASKKQVDGLPLVSLGMVNDDAVPQDEMMAKKVKGRKARVVNGYKIASISFLGLTMVMMKMAGIRVSAPYYSVTAALPSGLAYILSGAAYNNRLSSDTYKRLNVFLGKFSFINLVAAAFATEMRNPIWVVPCLIAMVNSIKGYGYGVLGYDKLGKDSPIQDLRSMTNASIKQMFGLAKNFKSAAYQAASITTATMKMAKLVEIVKLITECGDNFDRNVIATRLVRYSKLMLITIISLTLKDAADRDRLEGTTFIELNFMNSVAFASMAAYLSQEAITPLGCAAGFFSLFSAYNGIASILKKRKN